MLRSSQLFHQMVYHNRQYIIKKAKRPLRLAIMSIGKRWPKPTRDNCVQPNSQILLDIQDEFLARCLNPGRKPLFEAALKIFICEYEHDIYYRQRFDWVLKKIIESEWLFGGPPETHWNKGDLPTAEEMWTIKD